MLMLPKLALITIMSSLTEYVDGRGLEVEVKHAPCVRLFHSGGDVGCRTDEREGVMGVLLTVENEAQLRDIEKIDDYGGYVFVVTNYCSQYCLNSPTE